MHRRTTRLAAYIACLLVVYLLVPPAPASAAPVDVAYDPPTGWSSTPDLQNNAGCVDGGGGSPGGDDEMTDNNDTSWTACTAYGAGSPRTRFQVNWTRSSGVTDFDVRSFALIAGPCTSGWPNYGSSCGAGAAVSHLTAYCAPTTGDHITLGEVIYDEAISLGGGKVTIEQTNFDAGGCAIGAASGFNRIVFDVFITGPDADFAIWTFQAFDEVVAPDEVPITDYLYNLRISHPPFERVITWNWRDDNCSGSWSITNSEDEVLDTDFLNCAGEFVGDSERVHIGCPIICADDTYTITVNDTGRNRVATYEIDGDSDGLLIPNSIAPVITRLHGCYNQTTNQCSGLDASLWTNRASGVAEIAYTFEGDDSEVDICQRSKTESGFACDGGALEIASMPQGAYRAAFTVDTSRSSTFLVRAVNAVGQYDYEAVTLNFGTGGQVETPVDDTPGGDGPAGGGDGTIRECTGLTTLSIELVACRLGQLLDIVGATFEATWQTSITSVRDAAAQKLPFAYIVMAFDGVGEQIERAQAEVESSSTCPGLTLEVPILYGSTNLDSEADVWEFTVLTCSQLEATPLGSTWYQAVRTALDPALWLLFAWSQFKQLQPKPSLNG